MTSLFELFKFGQSVWLDYIDRNLVANGALAQLVADGLRGVTTNPTIFHKAITGSSDYDGTILDLLQADHEIDPLTVYRWLSIEDVQMAADTLRPVYDSSKGGDGYVSVEVSPHLAYDTEETIDAVRELWREVHRPNVMIKVPGTLEGLPAIEQLIAEGINVNVTLLFSVERYEQVFHAYVNGLARNPSPQEVASVASFFVSRVDSKIDPRLDEIGTPEAAALKGRIAIANSKMAYQRFKALVAGEAFAGQQRRGARVQRLLWGSTSTKNPAYSDVMYVNELIGPHTVNTVPPETLDAYLARGEARLTLEEGVHRACSDLEALGSLGINLTEATAELVVEGVEKFKDSHDALVQALGLKLGDVARNYAAG